MKIANSYRPDRTDNDLLFLMQIGVEYVKPAGYAIRKNEAGVRKL